jgi:hypothetical protein
MVSDRSNICGHFTAHNRVVGRFYGRLGEADCHCLWASCGIPGGAGCRQKWEAGFGAASRPNGGKPPRHKGKAPTRFSDVRFIKNSLPETTKPRIGALVFEVVLFANGYRVLSDVIV